MDWVFFPLAFQSQHLLCPERALLLHSYCATAWGNPRTAGRGWEGLETSPRLAQEPLAPRLPWAKPNLCSDGPATQDSPCACTRGRQCLPLPLALPARHGVCRHCCHAVHGPRHPLLVLLCLHEPPQTAAAPCSQLGLVDQWSSLCPLPVRAEPPHVAASVPGTALPLICLASFSCLAPPGATGHQLRPSSPLEMVEDSLGVCPSQGAIALGLEE